MTSSLTTTLEEMTINNEQLRREVDVLKSDNTQLRTNNDAKNNEIKQLKANNDKQKDKIIQLQAKQKDEIRQLTTLLDRMAVSQSNEIIQFRNEVQQLKVSWWSGIT